MAEDLYDKTRREYLESEARLQREYARQAAELGTDPELLRLKFENPQQFQQVCERVSRARAELEAERQARIERAKEALRVADELANELRATGTAAKPTGDKQRLQDALARLMKQRAGK
jgi:hypothetical protein